jgi:hypothetical protein
MSSPSQPSSGEGPAGKGGGAVAGDALSPWPVRLAIFVLLAAMAVAAIWVIDRHAMALQGEGEPARAGNG